MILVFGSNGQLGQELSRAAAAHGVDLRGLSHNEADIADAGAIATALGHFEPDIVVNAAAYTKVDLAETEVEDARRGNEAGPASLAGACAGTAISGSFKSVLLTAACPRRWLDHHSPPQRWQPSPGCAQRLNDEPIGFLQAHRAEPVRFQYRRECG